MGHEHSAGATSASRAEDRRRLVLVLVVTGSVAIVEVVGAWLSGSLALLADAGHMFTDASGIVLALAASLVATRPATTRRTFGYHRAEILAALVNALVLLGVCGFIVVQAVRRLRAPADVDAPQMVLFAVIGLLANVVSLLLLRDRHEESLNMKGAYLEVVADTIGSIGAVAAGLIIWTTGWVRADAVLSLAIAALILPRSWALLRESLSVLLESTPQDLSVEEIRSHLAGVDGVVDVHDLHAWSITTGMPALSAHVVVADGPLQHRGVGAFLDQLSRCVHDHFGIAHATFQIEPQSHRAHESGTDHD
jgi:cobalt-zinc-cadmium efflux system protein